MKNTVLLMSLLSLSFPVVAQQPEKLPLENDSTKPAAETLIEAPVETVQPKPQTPNPKPQTPNLSGSAERC